MVKREFIPSVKRRRIPLSEDERVNRASASGWVLSKVKSGYRPFETRYTMNHDESIIQSNKLGPLNRTVDLRFPAPAQAYRKFYRIQTSYRSKFKRARVQPNTYAMAESHTTFVYKDSTYWDCPNSWAWTAVVRGANSFGDNCAALAMNKARERFVNACKDKTSAQLGTTLAEWRQSEKMIVARAGQILSGLKALKRGDVKALERALQIDADTQAARKARKSFRGRYAKGRNPLRDEKVALSDQVRSGSKDLSNLWLEYHFGWAPLVDDIQTAIRVLASNPPSQAVRATGSASASIKDLRGQGNWNTLVDLRVRAAIGAEVYISNSNLALANQMGLVNPVGIAWELVPFSFLVDWFIPVGKFLESWTDMLGYTVRYAYNTQKRNAFSDQYFLDGRYVNGGRAEGASMYRELGIPPFRFVRPPFQGFSVARGATAIALVIQQFLSLKK